MSRYRLHRAGILNVWQYDEQVFDISGGRLLLRGTNGAGKSKTLEMLLPFALDGDKARMTASASHHTSLLWLMTDGFEGGNRIGYVWVEFCHEREGAGPEYLTCGVGIRASATARQATAWHFCTEQRVGVDLQLEDAGVPISAQRLGELVGPENVFAKASDYKAHVGRRLFELEPAAYDEVLRLLYWLRRPQVGEDIEPRKLVAELSQALPPLDNDAIRMAGDAFDELADHGTRLDRRTAAAEALESLATAFGTYARAVLATRARALHADLRDERRARTALATAVENHRRLGAEVEDAEARRTQARADAAADRARLQALEQGPEARTQRELGLARERANQERAHADRATERTDRQEVLVARAQKQLDTRRSAALGSLADIAERLPDVDRRLRDLATGARTPLPVALSPDEPSEVENSNAVRDALGVVVAGVSAATTAVRARIAAVEQVRDSIQAADQARSRVAPAEQAADAAEARWERARDELVGAEQNADREAEAFDREVRRWAESPQAPTIDLPHAPDQAFDESSIATLPALARDAAAEPLSRLRSEAAQVRARRADLESSLTDLRDHRTAVDAERDPAPPPPPLPRTPRNDGRALWQSVDLAPDVSDDDRAGLEAALQASGLLDAWIRPGGRLLDAQDRDVVLQRHERHDSAPTVASLLVVDLPEDSDLSRADVEGVLAGIGLSRDPADDRSAWVGVDGSWRLGPAHGRATKARAQFLGATARAAERRRRLDEIDASIAEAEAALAQAITAIGDLDEQVSLLEQWVAAVPRGTALLTAWGRVEDRRTLSSRAEAENSAAQDAAHAVRAEAGRLAKELQTLAQSLGLPAEREPLRAREQALRALADSLASITAAVPRSEDRLAAWEEAHAQATTAREACEVERAEQRQAVERAELAEASFAELRDAVAATVQMLEARLEELATAISRHDEAARHADADHTRLTGLHGAAGAEVRAAEERLDLRVQQRGVSVSAMAAPLAVPGIVEAAEVDAETATTLGSLATAGDGLLPRPVLASVEALTGISTDDEQAQVSAVWRAQTEVTASAAADHQPGVAEYGDILSVTGHDEAGEAPIVTLARRVRIAVDRDRELLTQQEKQRFERFILGELGDKIRARRRDAEELVAAMNAQLGRVSTSQGIRVRLDWKLRDDIAPHAREAVDLLAQPVGALLPEERERLRDALHHLIESSRVESPDLTYAEHLDAALDYRRWSHFTIRYQRPEKPTWERLHGKSAVSQGEQKVLCYLPLFAAAAAHFTSLAGAAPHAPRLVLLDDAFPKIDALTHPLLFGLLVDLDLDFVITSERLWGDHDTVPALSIYEALRDPNQRGIAQAQYRWDGHTLEARA